MNDIIQTIAVYAIPVIFAITLHEAAHGYVARMLGDPTAYQAGRVSLNPARHIDPVGTLLVPVAILLASKLIGGSMLLFGWAKPVPVDFGRLRRPKKDMAWVALAGPAANMFMAILWALSLRLFMESGLHESFWFEMAVAGVNVNLVLMALNLLVIDATGARAGNDNRSVVSVRFPPISVKLSGFTESGPGAIPPRGFGARIYGIPCYRRRR